MSRIENLTRQFYEWEHRCRGWVLYDYPVDLEPPFEPFFFHEVQQTPAIDDGLRPSIITKALNLFKNEEVAEDVTEVEPLYPYPYANEEALITYSVSLPKDKKVEVAETEQMLLMLSQSRHPISFEIVANGTSIRLQFVCRESDQGLLYSIIKAYFPDSGIKENTEGPLISEGKDGHIIDFGLEQEFMRPIATCKNFNIDPLTGIFGILEHMKADEEAVIQILFKAAVNPWSESVLRSVTAYDGKSFFMDAPEMIKLAEEKICAPLFGVVVRIAGVNDTGDTNVAVRLASALIQVSGTPYNSLLPLKGYDIDAFIEDIALRQSHRLGMLLNCKELATFVHFPSDSVVSYKLERDTRKTKKAPAVCLGHKFEIGVNEHQGVATIVSVNDQQRLKHTHIIGATGTGKSTLLLSSIVRDITNGEGVAVLDPHGDLIENILPWVIPNRHKDVILIDPADSDFPVGFNILTAHSEIEKDILSSDLVAVFRRLSTSWGDQMNSVFANAILALLESSQGGTLVDLRRFLIEKPFRDQFLKTVSDPSIIYYWQKEFPLLKSSSIGPILTRLDSFLRPKLIRNMVAQNKSLDFEDILDSKKILLIKLSQGLIGTENSYLLGTFIVSKIQQAAMARQAKAKAERSNFYLYIDEFQNFITPSMSTILSGARKYGLGLILAHQDLQQLVKSDTELASSVIANAGTRICFRLGDTDAKKFESGFSFFDANDLQNLDTGQAIVRIERPENDCNISTLTLPELEEDVANTNKDMVIAASREGYGSSKEEIEALMWESHEVPVERQIIAKETFQPQPVQQPVIPISPIEMPKPKVNQEEKKQETQHRYLQTLIKRMAESRGFKAVIEEPTKDGGRVDVGLLKNESRIAIEISITTPGTWEIQNIQKCLSAGYVPVIVCSADTKHLEKVKKFVTEQLSFDSNILFLEPEALFLYLDQQTANELTKEDRVKGYRVKVEYNAVSENDAQAKRTTILKSVADSLKSKKK